MKRKYILKSLPLVLVSVCLIGTTSVYAAGKTLTVGVRGDIMNFGYYNETTGKFYGMEIDLANKLAEKLGYSDVEFKQVEPDTRKNTLLNGEVDCLIAAYSISDSRQENFDFSPAYYTDDTKIMVEKSSQFTDIQDLKDKTVGILAGVNAGPILAQKLADVGIISEIIENVDGNYTQYDGIRVVQLESYDEVSKALEEGTIDAACMDGMIANAYRNDDRDYIPLEIAEQSYGVATQKNSELSEAMAEAVQKLLDDGIIEALIDKWD